MTWVSEIPQIEGSYVCLIGNRFYIYELYDCRDDDGVITEMGAWEVHGAVRYGANPEDVDFWMVPHLPTKKEIRSHSRMVITPA